MSKESMRLLENIAVLIVAIGLAIASYTVRQVQTQHHKDVERLLNLIEDLSATDKEIITRLKSVENDVGAILGGDL